MILNLSKGQEELKVLLLERKHEAQVDTVLMPYTQSLPCLLEVHLIKRRALSPPPTNISLDFGIDTRCVYLSGAPGHFVEDSLLIQRQIPRLDRFRDCCVHTRSE